MTRRSTQPQRRKQRHEEAVKRQAERDTRGDAGQLARLDTTRMVAKKERARLAARMK